MPSLISGSGSKTDEALAPQFRIRYRLKSFFSIVSPQLETLELLVSHRLFGLKQLYAAASAALEISGGSLIFEFY